MKTADDGQNEQLPHNVHPRHCKLVLNVVNRIADVEARRASCRLPFLPGFLPAAIGRMTVCIVMTGTSLGSPSVARKSAVPRQHSDWRLGVVIRTAAAGIEAGARPGIETGEEGNRRDRGGAARLRDFRCCRGICRPVSTSCQQCMRARPTPATHLSGHIDSQMQGYCLRIQMQALGGGYAHLEAIRTVAAPSPSVCSPYC